MHRDKKSLGENRGEMGRSLMTIDRRDGDVPVHDIIIIGNLLKSTLRPIGRKSYTHGMDFEDKNVGSARAYGTDTTGTTCVQEGCRYTYR